MKMKQSTVAWSSVCVVSKQEEYIFSYLYYYILYDKCFTVMNNLYFEKEKKK